MPLNLNAGLMPFSGFDGAGDPIFTAGHSSLCGTILIFKIYMKNG
jgi:hypothetical protein